MSKTTKKPRNKRHNPHKVKASYKQHKLAIGKSLLTPTDDIDLMDQPDAAFQALKLGQCNADDFNKIVEIVISVFVAGQLLQERGVGETKLMGWTYKSTGQEASLALQHIAKRYKETGKLIGTGDQLRAVGDALAAMRNIIPALTRGELVTVLHEAANMIEEGERDYQRLQAAGLIPEAAA